MRGRAVPSSGAVVSLAYLVAVHPEHVQQYSTLRNFEKRMQLGGGGGRSTHFGALKTKRRMSFELLVALRYFVCPALPGSEGGKSTAAAAPALRQKEGRNGSTSFKGRRTTTRQSALDVLTRPR